MTIAIDFDNTWTADAALWKQFADDAKKRGHDVIIVTARNFNAGWSDDIERKKPATLHMYFSHGELKRPYMEALGIPVDIWIDDQPGTIEPCRKLPDASDSDM